MENKKIIPYANGELHRLDWDIVVKDVPYYGYIWYPNYDKDSPIYGEIKNKYYICKRDVPEDQITEHLVYASREDMGVRWKIEISENSYTKTKWDETSLRTNVPVKIYRNDKLFHQFVTGSIDYAWAKAKGLIIQWQEHSLWLSEIDFDKKMVGKKVWFRDEPAIVDHFIWGEGAVWLVPDKEEGCEYFKQPKWQENDKSIPHYWGDYAEGLQVDLLDKDIWWWRD